MAAEAKISPELTKAINEATTSDGVRDALAAQPRDEKGQFTTANPAAEAAKQGDAAKEAVVVKDTFLIGGKPVEFEAESPEQLLSLVKVAQQTWQMAQPQPEEKKPEPPKPAFSKDELAALSLRVAQGDLGAMDEYFAKSGTIDRFLEARGIKPEEIKQVLADNASQKVVKDWDGAVKDFLATSDWPGGTQNEKLLKYKLAELKDDNGQALAYSPSKASLERAYAALREENMLFPSETVKTEEQKTTQTVEVRGAPVTQKRPATGSTAFGTSAERGTRQSAAVAAKVPEITPEMSGEDIMRVWKNAVQSSGGSPDDALRTTFAGRA